MPVYNNITELVGKTPLVRLNKTHRWGSGDGAAEIGVF